MTFQTKYKPIEKLLIYSIALIVSRVTLYKIKKIFL